MDKLNFKVSTELKTILGRDLITDDNIAVLELVKNSYDAYARKVEITFTKDEIIIADNGKGMTYDDIINKWLFVGYSAKRDGSEDDSYRKKINKKYAGAKGIGRISCDRLAERLTLITKNSDSVAAEKLEVNWKDFELDQSKEFNEIEIPHETLTNGIPVFPNNSETGTILHFHSIYTDWTEKKIKSLRVYLEKMINPFSDIDNFQIELFCPSIQGLSGLIENSIVSVLNIKTTQIESSLKNGIITTTIVDRGTLMYKIEESNKFDLLSDVQVNLYYLNRAAKYNFSAKMGVQPVSYGNVFLFRNGFRILPYGEEVDDSWGLNRRSQQGYNRFLGTRDLFGRVNVETDDVDSFKEVSSRDGGLIKTPAVYQLMNYFNLIHHRLERYVTGVLWGGNFLSKDYFQSVEQAQKEKEQLQDVEKDSDNVNHIYENLGSKIDFLQLIKSLTNDDSINVIEYNKDLANLVNNVYDLERIQTQFINDLRKVANQTSDDDLMRKIDDFEHQLIDLRDQKEKAEKQAAEELVLRQKAEKKAALAEEKRIEEANKRKEVELNLNAQKEKNKYLSAVRNTTVEVEDVMHIISFSSSDLSNIVKLLEIDVREGIIDREYLLKKLDLMKFHVERIKKLSNMLTKADIKYLREAISADVPMYIEEYVLNFNDIINIKIDNQTKSSFYRIITLLDLSIVLDNLISNSRKASASNILITFKNENNALIVDFADDGDGVDLKDYTSKSIFEEGVTNRRGGSGIGLSTIKSTMENYLNGEISFLGNGLYLNGATFELKFF